MRYPNVVPNGGFEAHADGRPTGWELDVVPEDFLLVGKLSAEAHTGRYSFCVEKGLGRRGRSCVPPPSI